MKAPAAPRGCISPRAAVVVVRHTQRRRARFAPGREGAACNSVLTPFLERWSFCSCILVRGRQRPQVQARPEPWSGPRLHPGPAQGPETGPRRQRTSSLATTLGSPPAALCPSHAATLSMFRRHLFWHKPPQAASVPPTFARTLICPTFGVHLQVNAGKLASDDHSLGCSLTFSS